MAFTELTFVTEGGEAYADVCVETGRVLDVYAQRASLLTQQLSDHEWKAGKNPLFAHSGKARETFAFLRQMWHATGEDAGHLANLDLVFARKDAFTQAYIECALWSSMDESTPNGGEPMDKNYGPEDLSPACLGEMIEDCRAFQADHWEDIKSDPGCAGHDFWLTRNHHGAGFWDGDWPDEIGKRLTEAAHVYGSVDLYVGDDGKIHAN